MPKSEKGKATVIEVTPVPIVFYILKGKKIHATFDSHEWAEYFNRRTRIIRSTKLKDGVVVSTVFLGLDHGFPRSAKPHHPVLFETMIFGGEFDQYQERYCTYDEAEDGHLRAVAKVKDGKNYGK